MKIYICGPYTPVDLEPGSDDYLYYRDQFIANAEEAGKKILLKNHTPIIPHMAFKGWELDPRFKDLKHSDWIEHCLHLLCGCNGILLLLGWNEHNGCKTEFFHWTKRFDNENVFYNLEDIEKI
jgi:hypothetical protein